ncbi:MAG: zinc ribbon domain-containing protein [Chloroflexi bacterium]|nr:zinc ribbon domain-containing protein [Chloroflexota bacterium]
MKKINWLVVSVISIIVLLFLFGGGMMAGGWGHRGWGMMGPGMTLAPGASAGVGGWGYSPLGWIGMAFMWLIPVGFIALVVFGIAWLARNVGNSTPPSAQTPCPNCAKGVQTDWQNCPYCGTTLK